MNKILSILFLFSISAFANDSEIDAIMAENGLTPYPVQNIGHRQFFTNHKFVRVESGQLHIESDGRKTNHTKMTVGDVEYIGINNGEFGGKLEVIENGVPRELMKGNIVHLLPFEKGLYVIEGLSHMSSSGGSINFIPDRSAPSKPQLITLLPDAPRLVYVDKTRLDYQPIIIVGYRSVMELTPFGRLDILHWDGFWSYKLSPTSITRYKNNFLIGFPYGVVALPAPRGSQNIVFYAENEFNKARNPTASPPVR